MADFLSELGLNSYLYCPKADACLRREWHSDWPARERAELGALARHCESLGLLFGAGLAPFAAYLHYGARERERLRRRVAGIESLGFRMLAILFDDMPGEVPDLAARQAEILADASRWAGDMRLLCCPTYYSFDPLLERHFGAMPERYWQRLGAELPAEVDILWTGNEVCPATVAAADVLRIAALLGRQPVLWDNYPVNDGRRSSNYLRIRPLSGREGQLRDCLAGHLCNPMNQCRLSRSGVSGLAGLYGARQPGLAELYGEELAALLAADSEALQERGLSEFDRDERVRLRRRYAGLGHPAAAEVVAWLDGEFGFDPACLTA